MQVKIYSTSTCPHCVHAKEYLTTKGVSFETIDVSENQAAVDEMVKLSGQMGVPVIVIDQEVIVGFNKDRIDSFFGA